MRRQTKCGKCGESMLYQNLARHLQSCSGDGKMCPSCERQIVPADIHQHLIECARKWYKCDSCQDRFTTARAKASHACHLYERRKKRRIAKDPENTISALGGLFKMIEIVPTADNNWSVPDCLESEKDRITDILETQLEILNAIKFHLSIEVSMFKMIDDGQNLGNFRAGSSELLESSDISALIDSQCETLIMKMDKFVRNGSGWVMDSLRKIHINITKYTPMRIG